MAKRVVVSSNPDTNWNNNDIQFPRLLAELYGTGGFTDEQRAQLAESMDLDTERIEEILLRAVDVWDDIKQRTGKL